ncbi:efflux RND transporter periplasmic adaptor subunit [Halodesulfovibrio spirochaetisodalis]|uniref:YknX-like C-terminal permuted SH3-like domain-containing protein n=1 Tax=Halodesulfovibrio spirochaetisodalis TaxID=1560234 RepID=A0A1B7XQ27_9BACT|nr:efflux RND transporter periplasmic adaptor subunit [Halodesulfovibrio spirochaetisodalis]OBQ57605.1 hypothetical protein SP90_00725 [Halodesulfovibrio spirochaetisodalis]
MKLSRNSKTILFIGLLCATIAAATVLNKNNETKDIAQPSRKNIRVTAVSATRGKIRSWVFGEGTVRAVRRELLTFEQAGKVVFIAKEKDGRILREGAQVMGPVEGQRLGQLLARVDKRDNEETYIAKEAELFEARQDVSTAEHVVEQAQTDLNLAEANYLRMQSLYKIKAISAQKFQQQEAQKSNAQAQYKTALAKLTSAKSRVKAMAATLRKAQISIERTGIFAPFDGVITYMNIKKGDHVQPASINNMSEDNALRAASIVVIDPSEYEITMDLPVYDGVNIKEGQSAVLAASEEIISPETTELESGSNIATASVWAVTPAVTPEGRTIKVKLRTTSNPEALRDGLYINGWIAITEKEDALIAPRNSVIFRDNHAFVFVVNKDGSVSKRAVTIGIHSLTRYEITSGITSDELIVTNGKHLLVDGSLVEVIPVPHTLAASKAE